MSWQTLRPQIATLLTNTGLFQEVSATPKLKFSGYPACYVAHSGNESEYNNTTENSRVYAFTVVLLYSTKKVGVSTALTRLEKKVDSVIDAIDQDSLKSASTRVIGISMPSKYTWINTFATPSVFGQVDAEELVIAELNVSIRVLVDIT
jgi:hypothetical protein